MTVCKHEESVHLNSTCDCGVSICCRPERRAEQDHVLNNALLCTPQHRATIFQKRRRKEGKKERREEEGEKEGTDCIPL
jgi:hypothetical protein